MVFNDKSLINFLNKNDYNGWEEVVKAGVDLLVQNNKATPELAEKIFESTKKYGPYYVIIPDVALLHAEAGPHCLKPGLSAMVLEEPVEFGYSDDNKKSAKVIFTLSAPNNTDHISLIQKFAIELRKEELIENLLNSKNKKEIEELLKF